MKLYWTPASPFVRKVMVAAIELGLRDRIEIVPTVWPHSWATHTVDFDSGFVAANPIGRIPALVTDEGVALPESNWICFHLDSLLDRPRLLPESGVERLEAMRLVAVGDGAIEAMILRRAETLRHPPERSDDFIGKQRDRIARCFDEIEHRIDHLNGPVDLAQICAGVGCSYMDFRYPEDGWRDNHPRLAEWFAVFAARPSMTATEPAETPQKA
jgi:glutathione S-transferase